MELQREPLGGEKGRATDGEYTLELAPQRFSANPVGVPRERPLPRCRVLARLEAVLREETANQRWYRESISPSVLLRDGGFYFARSAKFMIAEQERLPCRFTKNWLPVA